MALHAEKGVGATSYRDIAARADVAVPTVYKHFPDLPGLLSACTAHSAAGAPVFTAEIFQGSSTLESRVRALVKARCDVNAYFEPWLKWGGERAVPEIAAVMAADLARTQALTKTALEPAYRGGRVPADTLRAAVVLLTHASWATLRFGLGLTPRQVEAQLEQAILRLAR